MSLYRVNITCLATSGNWLDLTQPLLAKQLVGYV